MQHIHHSSTQLLKMKQQLIKLLDEIQRESERLSLLKKNFEHQINEQHSQNLQGQSTGTTSGGSGTGTGTPAASPSVLYDRFLSAMFDVSTSPDQEIEKQILKINKLEKEKEKKSQEMEEKKIQLLFALEEKDRIWAAVSD
jgi:hypothetical protein